MRKLSEYTKAKNCTDLQDINDALTEIYEAIDERKNLGWVIPAYYYIRICHLSEKKRKFEK